MKISGRAKRRLATTVLAVAVLAVPFAPSTGPAALNANRSPLKCPLNTTCGTLYYSDSGHTNLVGAQITNCQAVLSSWGVQTGYSQYVQSPCD
jgi:Family of unknown function (DUF6289)